MAPACKGNRVRIVNVNPLIQMEKVKEKGKETDNQYKLMKQLDVDESPLASITNFILSHVTLPPQPLVQLTC